MKSLATFSFLAVPGTEAAFRILSLRFTPAGKRTIPRSFFAATAAE
jgi:hypothetical protein